MDLCVPLANAMGVEQVPFVAFLNPHGVKPPGIDQEQLASRGLTHWPGQILQNW